MSPDDLAKDIADQRRRLETELASAVEQDMARTGPGSPVERRSTLKASLVDETPKRATDQLAAALAGLLRVEEQLTQLTNDLVGPMKEAEPPNRAEPAEGLPTFDKVRADARSLAELALRLNARIEFLRSRI